MKTMVITIKITKTLFNRERPGFAGSFFFACNWNAMAISPKPRKRNGAR
jgi:hypothetical protein